MTDNGKVFTGRFAPGTGEVLFDRICRENGIRHLLTAPPHSPTTTGKVEHFHKTVRALFRRDRVFVTITEVEEALEARVEGYDQRRPHQSLGMAPPVTRFCLAVPEVVEKPQEPTEDPRPPTPPGRTVTRVVGRDGRISLACFAYPVGRWPSGETVEVVLRYDGLLEVFHRGVLIRAHAQRHDQKQKPQVPVRSHARPKPLRPSSDRAVIRLVDPTGCISFAGTSWRVGKAFRGSQVEVETTEETVRIILDGECIRTHAATHDPRKLHGAFATPGGRPRKAKAG